MYLFVFDIISIVFVKGIYWKDDVIEVLVNFVCEVFFVVGKNFGYLVVQLFFDRNDGFVLQNSEFVFVIFDSGFGIKILKFWYKVVQDIDKIVN